MILFFKIFLFVCSISYSLVAFDVRVLLEKHIVSDDKKIECKISSQHGMTISGVENPIHGPVSIICTDKNFIINNTIVEDTVLSISPILSLNNEKKIHQFITQWSQDNHDFYTEKFKGLTNFYEKFVNDSQFRQYSILYEVMHECIDTCIADFIKNIEHPAISYESLIKLAHQQIGLQFKQVFVDAIHEKKLSKKVLKEIKISDTIRQDFFVPLLQKILINFLTEFLGELPHKIIHQAIKEETGCLLFDKNKYLGTFYLMRFDNKILVVNSLDIDDYLLSVLRSEGWPGWPMEVNKALVIANRTYLVEKILQANKLKQSYHIVNSNYNQTYKGHHTFKKLKQAVDETHNIFISYQGKPIVAMFDSSCGGIIPAKIEGMDFIKHPYLARSKACTHCKKYWISSWKKELNHLEILDILKKDHPDLNDIVDIKITEKDTAGLIKKILVTTKKKKIYISGKKMYSLFSDIKSFSYTIKKKGKSYIFQGRGYGHHMGLCQWGALGMVEDNWNYKNILQFYYPGTELMKLSLLR